MMIISIWTHFTGSPISAKYQLNTNTWVPASAGKVKAGMVYSVSGWTRGVQVKLWDPLRTRAIPECLMGETTRRYTNPRLPYLTLLYWKWAGNSAECVGFRAPIKFVCKKLLDNTQWRRLFDTCCRSCFAKSRTCYERKSWPNVTVTTIR